MSHSESEAPNEKRMHIDSKSTTP